MTYNVPALVLEITPLNIHEKLIVNLVWKQFLVRPVDVSHTHQVEMF